MTKNRKLKRRIRERMAETGEKYTVARLKILDKAGPYPDDLPIPQEREEPH